MTELKQGDRVPALDLPADGGGTLKLSSFKGKPVVVYFYPKDDTPGCTSEAKDFSCLTAEFEKAGAAVIGISPDSPESHDKFKAKHDLAIRLASDRDHRVAEAFGVWVEKSMYGKKYMGVERATFLVGKDGKLARVWRKVKVPGHAAEVLAAVKGLTAKS